MSFSTDYNGGSVVIRDMMSEPKGRVFAIIPRENRAEGEQVAQRICDLLNSYETELTHMVDISVD